MDLDRYAEEAHRHCAEIFEELSRYDPGQVSEQCRAAGTDNFLALLTGNESDFLAYVRATPSARKRLLGKLAPKVRPMFLMAVLYHARCALALLRALSREGVAVGPPFRQVTARAAAAARRMETDWPSLWPFEDREDPFDGA